jgi:hypothetical protein
VNGAENPLFMIPKQRSDPKAAVQGCLDLKSRGTAPSN